MDETSYSNRQKALHIDHVLTDSRASIPIYNV